MAEVKSKSKGERTSATVKGAGPPRRPPSGVGHQLEELSRDDVAVLCGVAPGDPALGQKNSQIYAEWRLINEWWVTFGLVKSMIPASHGVDCSLLRELYEAGLAGEPDPHY